MHKFGKKPYHIRATRTRWFRRWHQHPFGLPIAVFFGLLAVSAAILIVLSATHTAAPFRPDTSYIVIISHDHQQQTVPTHEPTVGALLRKLGIHVGRLDRVEPAPDTPIVQDNLRVNIYRAVPVTITDGTTTTTAYSAAATPRSIVAQTGMLLYSEDEVTAAPAVNLVSEQSLGEQITITRSVPVDLVVYGSPLPTRTTARTVGQMLADKHVTISPKDTVLPARSTPITPGMQVNVIRNGTQIVTVTQSIPAPQQTVTDPSLSFGTSVMRQQGSPGTEVLTYQVNRQNGVEVSRTLLQTVITVQPVTQIVAQGLAVSIPADKQAVMAQAGISPGDYKYVDYIASHEGGWCPTKVQGSHDCPGYPPNPIPSYGGYGIFQATPGGKMASAGSDWATSAVTQIRWATGYADGRYGSWAGAYNHWLANHNW